MSDKQMVYVEDAIDALMEILDRPNHAEFLYTDEICKALEDLPSAQPETHDKRTETHACDLIDRQAAIDALNKMKIYRPLDSDRYVISDCLNKIVNLPSAQPQRIKGRWIRKESDLSWWYECSECGESPLFDPYEHEVRTPFCPWCGARMEEEEDAAD